MTHDEAKTTTKAGVMLLMSFKVMWIVNALIIFGFHLFAPTQVVLGTMSLSLLWALVISTTTLTLIGTAVMPLVGVLEIRRKKIFSSMEWMVLYFAVNFASIWVITRFAKQLGLGVSSWMWVIFIAFVLDMVQGAVMMSLGKKSEKMLKNIVG